MNERQIDSCAFFAYTYVLSIFSLLVMHMSHSETYQCAQMICFGGHYR